MMNLEGFRYDENMDISKNELDPINKWILTEYNQSVRKITEALNELNFTEYAHTIYESFWSKFCDWYLELTKPLLNSDKKSNTRYTLIHVLAGYLKLLSPVMPFISEEIYQTLKSSIPGHPLLNPDSIIVSPLPVYEEKQVFTDAALEVEFIMNLIRDIRIIRTDMNVPPKDMIEIIINSDRKDIEKTVNEYLPNLKLMTKVKNISFGKNKPEHCAVTVIGDVEVYIMLKDIIDFKKEKLRLDKNKNKLIEQIKSQDKKLTNKQFLEHAPASEVEKIRTYNKDAKEKLNKIQKYLEMIK
jgi:valyl-tRNA synthetase